MYLWFCFSACAWVIPSNIVIFHLHTLSYRVVSEKSFPFLLVWSVQCYLGLWSRSVQRHDAEGLRSGLATQPLGLGQLLEAPREVVYYGGFVLGIGYLDSKI